MKSQDQRIEDAARIIAQRDGHDAQTPPNYGHYAVARRILEAADRESPKWPTDETLDGVWCPEAGGVNDREFARSHLRTGMLADPIIRASVELRNKWPVGSAVAWDAASRVVDAVREAGL